MMEVNKFKIIFHVGEETQAAKNIKKKAKTNYLFVLACCGVHPGRVEPASSLALTTSRIIEALARPYWARPIEMISQSWFHRRKPTTTGWWSTSSWGPARQRGRKENITDKLTRRARRSVFKPAQMSLQKDGWEGDEAKTRTESGSWNAFRATTTLISHVSQPYRRIVRTTAR